MNFDDIEITTFQKLRDFEKKNYSFVKRLIKLMTPVARLINTFGKGHKLSKSRMKREIITIDITKKIRGYIMNHCTQM